MRSRFQVPLCLFSMMRAAKGSVSQPCFKNAINGFIFSIVNRHNQSIYYWFGCWIVFIFLESLYTVPFVCQKAPYFPFHNTLSGECWVRLHSPSSTPEIFCFVFTIERHSSSLDWMGNFFFKCFSPKPIGKVCVCAVEIKLELIFWPQNWNTTQSYWPKVSAGL